ncbi:magnesium transporter CorA family protein [Patescibacteria group bacterium]|nr:magnesium transporter CorA family protein [Patescibacteria group bacterium]
MLKFIKSEKLTWGNADKVDEQTINRLKKLYKFHHLDWEDVQSDIHDPKLDVYKNYLFAIFNVPNFKDHSRYVALEELDIFIGKSYIITIHKGGLKEIDELFKKLEKSSALRKEWLGKGTDFVLFKILQLLFKTRMKQAADHISAKLIHVEKNVYSHTGRQNIEELATLRRNVLSFRRLVDPQRELISSLAIDKHGFINDEYEPYFDDVRDYLDRIWTRLSNYKDTIDGLYETNESLLTYKTNEIIKILTIISVALMPPTLLSGIFGMNINLPFEGQPNMVWAIYGFIFAITMIIIFVLKKRKWF